MARKLKEPTSTSDKSLPNSLTGKAAKFIERYEKLDEEKKVHNAGIAADQKEIFEEAEEAGIPKKALRRTIKVRKQAADDAAQLEKMNAEERAVADALRQFTAAEEAFRGTGFGDHLRESLDALTKDGDVSVEFAGHPVMDRIDAMQREDEAHLQQIGRGEI